MPGAIHHVVLQGNNRQPIFVDDNDCVALLERLLSVADDLAWRCHAYCLMSTHAHLVLETPEANLGRGMQRLVGWYAFRFNRRHHREGHLFTGPYYSKVIESESQFIQTCVYVVLNAVAGGMCKHPRGWRWSSYAATAGLRSDDAARPDLLLGLLDGDVRVARRRYRELVDEAVRGLGQRTGA